jgi:hypothetical protein
LEVVNKEHRALAVPNASRTAFSLVCGGRAV